VNSAAVLPRQLAHTSLSEYVGLPLLRSQQVAVPLSHGSAHANMLQCWKSSHSFGSPEFVDSPCLH
jgi:hypothetical protein